MEPKLGILSANITLKQSALVGNHCRLMAVTKLNGELINQGCI